MTKEKEETHDIRVNFVMTTKEYEELEVARKKEGQTRSNFIRTVISQYISKCKDPTPIDLSKIEAQFNTMKETFDRRLQEQTKLFESFANIMTEMRENIVQSNSAVLQQYTNLLTTLQTLNAIVTRNMEETVKLMKEIQQ